MGAFKDEQLVAVNYVIIDSASAYYTASGFDPDFKTAAPMALLLWKAIEKASGRVQQFDFEGSTIPAVAGIFRNFGAKQVTYYNIYKSRNRFTDALLTMIGKL